MARYVVSQTNQDWEGTERFNTKPPAVARFRELAATGQFVRLVRWMNHQPNELDRANKPPAPGHRQQPAPTLAVDPVKPSGGNDFSVFISYRRGDSAPYAMILRDRLTEHFDKKQVFMDIDTIPLGSDFSAVLTDAIHRCDVLLVVIGPGWMAARDENGEPRLDDPDDFVRLEVAAALEQGFRVIPLLVGGARMPRREDLPEPLRPLARRNAMELHDGPSFRADVDRLIVALKGFAG